MKKSLFFYAAATALMLTACSSEDDILQTGQTKKVAPQEVGFDVYTQAATDVTRAGLEGTMTTSRLQRSEYEGGGFGVYAFQVQDNAAAAGAESKKASSYLDLNADGSDADGLRKVPASPNFMVNEKLLWNSTNMGWYYNPLKYWPNETDNDSQTSPAEMLGDNTNNHIDRLTFFAYAPYVSEGKKAETDKGILFLTAKDGSLNTKADRTGTSYDSNVREPSILYKAALDDPNEAVDLLWGVAPAGGLTYTAVNGKTVNVKEGEPLMDMTKPDVNTNMKFLFQHALARIGVTAVAAIDQVGAGGTLDPNTKITINKITLTGWFGKTGILNLDNEKANVANWYMINDVDLTNATVKGYTKVDGDASSIFGADLTKKTTLTLVADNTKDPSDEATNHQKGTIARHLQFVNVDNSVPATNAPSEAPVAQTNRVGVTTVRQNVIMPALIDNAPGAGHNRPWHTEKEYASGELKYSETTPYYTNANCTALASAKITAWKAVTKASDGSYTYVTSDLALTYPMDLKYYEIADWYTISSTDASNGTYNSYTAYDATTLAPTNATPVEGNKILKNGMRFVQLTAANIASYTGKQGYSLSTNTFVPKKVGETLAVSDYVLVGEEEKCAPAFTWDGGSKKTFYKRDNNYFMVVPTNNITNIVTGITDPAEEVKLRTVRVMIEYYITTEDSKLANGRAQTKNVIEKDVVFPSIANGKSYNLNLVLGLTSVKMEAEVDDWKVVNVQGDLPQNTATE